LVAFACNLPTLNRAAPTSVPGLATILPEYTPEPQATPTLEFQETPVIDQSLPAIPTQTFALYDMLPYTVQAGDTLPALAARFRTNIDNLLADNPTLPPAGQATTLEPGLQLSIRLIVEPFWDAGVLILPNSLYLNGPSASDFDTASYLATTGGWLRDYYDRSGEKPVSGVDLVNNVAANYSVNPRLLLALLEYRLKAISGAQTPSSFSLGSYDPGHQTLGRQLSWAANVLNNAYYGWRQGVFTQYTSQSGFTVNPNPWQNAATIAVQYYFSRFQSASEYEQAVLNGGFLQTFQDLFGPVSWDSAVEWALIPAGLQQPSMRLPFLSGARWAYTAGPHSGWGSGYPWAAIDFAPPSEV
ncbi:MAG: LysM domain-containing protein, partial [Anaerolineaceae bacterium]